MHVLWDTASWVIQDYWNNLLAASVWMIWVVVCRVAMWIAFGPDK